MVRVTKLEQSCLLVEADGRLLVDPGTQAVSAGLVERVGDVDAVLWTHRHADHFDERALDALRQQGATLVANADVASLLADGEAVVVGDGDVVEVAGFSVRADEVPHVPLVDGSPGPPNTAFTLDGVLLHPGDGLPERLRAEVLACPIAGPSISFHDAYRLVERTGARTVVPVHYDVFVADPRLFASACDLAEVRVLAPGESTDVG